LESAKIGISMSNSMKIRISLENLNQCHSSSDLPSWSRSTS